MSYQIPLFDLNFDDKEEKAVIDVIKSKWISTGPKNEEFENVFAELLGVNYAISLTNCTVALHLALILADVQENDEVICPSLTFVATTNVIRYLNAKPIFADISSSEDLNLSAKNVEALITPRTKAIIVMHYGGFPCDMDSIMEIANRHNIKVIEDACHGPLSEYKGKKLGTIGDIGCFSFFSNKNISTGEGGMLITNNEDIAKKAKLLRSHGMTTMSYQRAKGHATAYDVVEFGYNYRMDDMRAALGIVQLEKIKADLNRRAKVRSWYLKGLEGNPNVIVPFRNNTDFVSNYIFPIVISNLQVDRDDLRMKLQEQGIQTSVHYPAVHRFSVYKEFYTELPVTDYVTQNEVTLPMFAGLKEQDVNYICEKINSLT